MRARHHSKQIYHVYSLKCKRVKRGKKKLSEKEKTDDSVWWTWAMFVSCVWLWCCLNLKFIPLWLNLQSLWCAFPFTFQAESEIAHLLLNSAINSHLKLYKSRNTFRLQTFHLPRRLFIQQKCSIIQVFALINKETFKVTSLRASTSFLSTRPPKLLRFRGNICILMP